MMSAHPHVNQGDNLQNKQRTFSFCATRATPTIPKLRQSRPAAHLARASCARKLAKAERDARALGYTFDWEDDWSLGCTHEKYYGEAYANGEPATCESCIMRDPAGAVVQSLGCIDDATREYRRVVEAELALEQLG